MDHGHGHEHGPRWARQMWAGEMAGGWGGPRRRMRRSDIRRAVLTTLKDGPANGYEIMSRLEERSGGMWRPSPGSVYPTLQLLADEGLVSSEERDGARIYSLTESGTNAADADDGAPWDRMNGEGADQLRTLMQAIGEVAMAAKQVARAGRTEHVERSIEVVQRARRELYQILAE